MRGVVGAGQFRRQPVSVTALELRQQHAVDDPDQTIVSAKAGARDFRLVRANATVVEIKIHVGTLERGALYRGESGCGMTLNVADPDSVDTVIKAIGEQFSAPLILVNNAGKNTTDSKNA